MKLSIKDKIYDFFLFAQNSFLQKRNSKKVNPVIKVFKDTELHERILISNDSAGKS